MLINIDSDRQIQQVPYQEQFDLLRSRLSEAEFDDIVAGINNLIDAAGAEIATAGWLPGRDWTGKVFHPIYTKAARQNYELAARFFGQMVWYTVMERPERWASGRYKKDGEDIGSRTYFRIQ
jgi:hypothetical protein